MAYVCPDVGYHGTRQCYGRDQKHVIISYKDKWLTFLNVASLSGVRTNDSFRSIGVAMLWFRACLLCRYYDNLLVLLSVKSPIWINMTNSSWIRCHCVDNTQKKNYEIPGHMDTHLLTLSACEKVNVHVSWYFIIFLVGIMDTVTPTAHYHPCSNLGMRISEGCFIFDFTSVPFEVARPI